MHEDEGGEGVKEGAGEEEEGCEEEESESDQDTKKITQRILTIMANFLDGEVTTYTTVVGDD